MGPPEDVVFFLRDTAKVGCFIETGTYYGETTSWAAQNFSEVITIELSEKYFSQAQERFRDTPNVEVRFGDSKETLKTLVPQLTTPTMFWLDAHFCCDSAGQGDPAPILAEITTIYSGSKEHILLIDDARLFLSPPPASPNDEYPDVCELLTTLMATGNPYVVLHDDVLICVPQKYKSILFRFFQTVVYPSKNHTQPALAKALSRMKAAIKRVLR